MIVLEPIKFRLDHCPPSANRMWRKFRGHMVKSSEAKAWEKAAIQTFALQARGRHLPDPGYWQVQINLPRQSAVDLDNFQKPIIDALHRAGVSPDDRHLVSLRTQFWEGDHIVIYIKHERLEKWQPIMKTSKPMARRMTKALTSTLPL